MRYGLTNSEILNTLSTLRVPCGELTIEQITGAIRMQETILSSQYSKLSGLQIIQTSRLMVAVFNSRQGQIATIGLTPVFRDRLKRLPRMQLSREAQEWHALTRRVANGITSKLNLPDLHGEDNYEGSSYAFNLPENCHVD